MESKNKLVAFLKSLVAIQYKPSYTFNLFFLSQSPPASNKLQSGKGSCSVLDIKMQKRGRTANSYTTGFHAYILALSMDFEMRSKSIWKRPICKA
jgi:hypothetical protein